MLRSLINTSLIRGDLQVNQVASIVRDDWNYHTRHACVRHRTLMVTIIIIYDSFIIYIITITFFVYDLVPSHPQNFALSSTHQIWKVVFLCSFNCRVPSTDDGHHHSQLAVMGTNTHTHTHGCALIVVSVKTFLLIDSMASRSSQSASLLTATSDTVQLTFFS